MPNTSSLSSKLGHSRRLKRGELEVATVRFDRGELLAVPRPHLSFYLQLGQLMNEVSMLQSLLVRSLNGMKKGPRAVQETSLGMMLFLTRALCGRVVEAHQAINTKENGRLLSELWKALPLSARAAEVRTSAEAGRSRLNKALGPNSALMRLVRNKLAYHLDADVLLSAFDAMPPDFDLADFHTGLRGTTFFGVADTAAALAVSQFTTHDNAIEALSAMANGVLGAVADLQDFADGFLLAFYLVHVGEDRLLNAQRTTLKNLPEVESASLGYFMSSKSHRTR